MCIIQADTNPIAEFAKGEKKTWVSKDHPKAKGIKMKISYPASWKAEEGNRPNILQKFSGNPSPIMDVVTLTTRSLQAPYNRELTIDEKNSVLSKDSVKDILPDGSEMLSHKITKIDGEVCAMIEFHLLSERVGIKIGQKGIIYVIPRPGTLLLVQCSAIGNATNGLAGIEAYYERIKNLYLLIGSSCIFVDKWEE